MGYQYSHISNHNEFNPIIMHIAPHKKECQVIEYEALGMKHKAYASLNVNYDRLQIAVLLITETAHITTVYTDIIEQSEFDKKNIQNITEFHLNCLEYEAE